MENEETRKKALDEITSLYKEPKNRDTFEYLRILMHEESIESMFKRWQKNAGLEKKPEGK